MIVVMVVSAAVRIAVSVVVVMTMTMIMPVAMAVPVVMTMAVPLRVVMMMMPTVIIMQEVFLQAFDTDHIQFARRSVSVGTTFESSCAALPRKGGDDQNLLVWHVRLEVNFEVCNDNGMAVAVRRHPLLGRGHVGLLLLSGMGRQLPHVRSRDVQDGRMTFELEWDYVSAQQKQHRVACAPL